MRKKTHKEFIKEVYTLVGKENNIRYEEQKKFEGLVNIFQLSYDFYLPDYNILIEYQGEQHFKPKTFGGISKELAKERFKKQQVNDKIKNKFAKDNDFVLWEPTYKINTYSSMKSYLDKKFSLIEVKQGNI
ncbi:hypothetical protein qdsa001_68 [Staphylococcus phage qdsa001]|nr:hypothetical protein qdsa001_68 [Staphylococcus phage qdsa001]UGL60683.1 hypothetical protein [Staphylococcus phage vB_SauM-HM01]